MKAVECVMFKRNHKLNREKKKRNEERFSSVWLNKNLLNNTGIKYSTGKKRKYENSAELQCIENKTRQKKQRKQKTNLIYMNVSVHYKFTCHINWVSEINLSTRCYSFKTKKKRFLVFSSFLASAMNFFFSKEFSFYPLFILAVSFNIAPSCFMLR